MPRRTQPCRPVPRPHAPHPTLHHTVHPTTARCPAPAHGPSGNVKKKTPIMPRVSGLAKNVTKPKRPGGLKRGFSRLGGQRPKMVPVTTALSAPWARRKPPAARENRRRNRVGGARPRGGGGHQDRKSGSRRGGIAALFGRSGVISHGAGALSSWRSPLPPPDPGLSGWNSR